MLIALRFLANLFFLVAAIALIADLTPMFTGTGPFALTPFANHWADLSPLSLKSTQDSITETTGTFVWTYGIGALIALPTAILFFLFGWLFGYLGRRRKRINVFVN